MGITKKLDKLIKIHEYRCLVQFVKRNICLIYSNSFCGKATEYFDVDADSRLVRYDAASNGT
jgi:hypothetical protein